VLALALTAAAPAAQQPALEGTWEYRQANSARPQGVDAEGERIVVARTADGTLTAQYFGLEREGEHGLFYTAVEATAVAPTDTGGITLTVPSRQLYRTRPRSVTHARTLESAGQTREALVLSARLHADGTLVVACSAAPGACPDATMVFRRLQRPR
jgi:hypothetical protein